MAPRLRLVIAALVAATATVHAQPGATPPITGAPGDAPPTMTAPPGAPPSAVDPAARDYDAAFALLVAGDVAHAAAQLDDVAARARDPELIAHARELARFAHALLDRKVTFTTAGAADSAADIDDKVDGRTSFIAMTTLYGLYAGVVLAQDANIDDTREAILTVTGTTALGLFGSYFASKDRTMTGAMSDAYTLGMFEGFANGGLLAHPVGLGDTAAQIQTTALLMGGAGAIGGLLYAEAIEPTRGQIAFAGTLSMLGAASTGLGLGIAQPDMSTDAILTTIAIGTDAGLGIGLGLGRDLDWSVSRGRIVQLGVLLGGLTGLATAALINGDNSSNNTGQLISAVTLAGIWAGFGIATKLTSDMRPDRAYAAPAAPTAQLAPMAVRGGGGAMLAGSF